MTENVCVTCQYYESCNRPERFMKCMGYKEKQERGEENAQQTGRSRRKSDGFSTGVTVSCMSSMLGMSSGQW